MTGELKRELNRRAEIEAAKKREEKEGRIQRRLIELIKKYNIKIKELEEDVRILWQKEQKLTSEGKTFRAKLVRWRREKKQEKLADLKKITPSIKTQ